MATRESNMVFYMSRELVLGVTSGGNLGRRRVFVQRASARALRSDALLLASRISGKSKNVLSINKYTQV